MNKLDKFRHLAREQGFNAAVNSTIRWFFRKLKIAYKVEPYEYIQAHFEKHIHTYLKVRRDEIKKIIMVGAHMGYEVNSMLASYPNVEFRLFEASPRYGAALKSRFLSNPKVFVHECAVSNKNGELKFYETNLAGSGSVLKVGKLAESSYGMRQSDAYSVSAYRLDDHAAEHGYGYGEVDCLWIDVQGAEVGVLEGAADLLCRVKAVFVEVSIFERLYEGGALHSEINDILIPAGFTMVGLGIDPLNGTGNATYLRNAVLHAR